jgi:micrococcal nuclease
MKLKHHLIAAVMTLTAPAWSATFDVEGRVVFVDDGDTVVILTADHKQLKIRMASIDAPEGNHENHQAGRIGQPYAANATQHLAELIKGRTVQAHCYELDRYSRSVCDLAVDGRSVNQEMVRAGWAWANMSANGRYLRDKSLLTLEAKARADHAGLWAGRNPVEPWAWRDVCWKLAQCAN